ncbi:MAG: hypothetical protein IBX64_06425 [Actinobacteria bacterium]|nr:hypothetical protein [Actinomycetota bacterium]
MEDNKTGEVLSEATGGTTTVGKKHQVVKYILIWLAIVVLFFAFNAVIKSIMATGIVEKYGGGYYMWGQPANYGQAGGGSGNCGGSCCGSGKGDQVVGGKATDGTGQIDTSDPKQVEKAAIEWYAQKTGDRNVTAEVRDFGCHQQITIKKDGKAVSEISLRNGQFQSLTPW